MVGLFYSLWTGHKLYMDAGSTYTQITCRHSADVSLLKHRDILHTYTNTTTTAQRTSTCIPTNPTFHLPFCLQQG